MHLDIIIDSGEARLLRNVRNKWADGNNYHKQSMASPLENLRWYSAISEEQHSKG